MNKESIKTATLTVLIIISLFFTWNMWTMLPSYDELQNGGISKSKPLSQETRQLYEVIKPQQIAFHSGENHYSTIKADYLNSLWTEMQRWEYTEGNRQSRTFTKEEFQLWLHGKEGANVELKFSVAIPMATIQSMIKWDTDTIEDLSFDRIILKVDNNSELQKVTFVSFDKMKMVEAYVNRSEASHSVSALYENRSDFMEYFPFVTEQGEEILLPENKVQLNSYQYLTEELQGEKFKNALFSKPGRVKQDVSSSKNRYTDATKELSIYSNNHRVIYVNPALRNTNPVEANQLIEQSILFLNEHGGWTDQYILFETNNTAQETRFIMSIDSIPVMSSNEKPFGPTMIDQRWGQNEIASYERPSYQLNVQVRTDSSSLISGRRVVELITSTDQLDAIDNIFVAYELSGLDNQSIIKVTPVWCIQMNDGRLINITDYLELSGGDGNGME